MSLSDQFRIKGRPAPPEPQGTPMPLDPAAVTQTRFELVMEPIHAQEAVAHDDDTTPPPSQPDPP